VSTDDVVLVLSVYRYRKIACKWLLSPRGGEVLRCVGNLSRRPFPTDLEDTCYVPRVGDVCTVRTGHYDPGLGLTLATFTPIKRVS
jgi:hypothetical protein